MKNDIYLRSKDGDVTGPYIRDKLAEIGVRQGDTVMVSCRLPFLGRLERDKTMEALSRFMIDELCGLVGKEGTLAVPAYSYSFCKNLEFDVRRTPSDLGTFFETFRLLEGVVRTPDPIFSVCVKGRQAGFLAGGDPTDCFGSDSFFGRFHSLDNAKYLLIGLDYHYITNIHFIEEMHGVSYRFFKDFSGTVVDGNGIRSHRVQRYFVRNLEQEYDFKALFDHLRDNRIGSVASFGNSTIKVITDRDFFDTTAKLLMKDERFFLAPERNSA